jgi:hypothetical protein
MTNLLAKRFESTHSNRAQQLWIFGLSLILALWIGATVLLDFIVMPSLADAGMMSSAQFIPFGFSLFHQFNGIELIAGSMMLSGAILLLAQTEISHRIRFGLTSTALFLIPFVYFYYLGPEMAGLGLASNLSEGIPSSMNVMHYTYWGLDLLKLSCVGLYLSELWHSLNGIAEA